MTKSLEALDTISSLPSVSIQPFVSVRGGGGVGHTMNLESRGSESPPIQSSVTRSDGRQVTG